jgi:hypothetical protein
MDPVESILVEEAVGAYRRALEQDPDLEEARSEMGVGQKAAGATEAPTALTRVAYQPRPPRQ